MGAWKCLSKNAASGDVTHCAEAQEVGSPESFLSSLQEALGEFALLRVSPVGYPGAAISSSKAVTSVLSRTRG